MMGGRIWAESTINNGSTFSFVIRVKEAGGHDMPGAVELPGGKSAARHNQGTQQVTFEGRRIILADDVDINREIVLALFESTGIVIDCATNGAEAVQLFKNAQDSYDLILMDVQMPEMDGREATRRIRAIDSEAARKIPIIAMTAHVFQEDINTCLAAGMNSHLGKPINFDDVLAKLREYMPAGNR
jgi:CheY-like chemotaxis protein